jgi:hypothetical protein
MGEPEGGVSKVPTGAATEPAVDLQLMGRRVDAGASGDTQSIQAELGPGHSLDSGVSSRMTAALGHSFSNARSY